MTTTHRAGILATGLVTTAFLLAACGGATTPSVGTDGGSISSDAPTDAAPTTEPTTSTATDAPDPSALAIPSFDLDDLVANLDGVDSYRTVMTVAGEQTFESKVVTKPVLARDITINEGGSSQRIVVIGEEAWVGTGDDLQPAPAAMATAMLGLFDPMLLAGGLANPGAMAGATQVGTEEKNGVQATHYRIDGSSLVGTLASMPPGAAIDLWVAEAGYLVSLSISGNPEGDFAIDVFDVNDPSIVVERP
jgi:hypothetical protein